MKPALLDILAGVGIPVHQRLMDQLIKPGAHRRKNNLIQERWHQQVAVTLQGLSLLRDEQPVAAAHDRDSCCWHTVPQSINGPFLPVGIFFSRAVTGLVRAPGLTLWLG